VSKKSIKYLKSIENEREFNDIFIISFLGLLGLSVINANNNLLLLKMKKYRVILNQLNDDSMDIYYIIQSLYDQKKIKISFALDLIDVLQKFRQPNFTFSLVEQEIKELLEDLPPIIYTKLSGDVKLFFKAYLHSELIDWNITKLVNKFYSFANRKKYTEIDFVQLAKNMKRMEVESEDIRS